MTAYAERASGPRAVWRRFAERRPSQAQFIVFFLLSNGNTALQILLLPLFKLVFAGTALAALGFQVLPVGSNVDGSQYYVFDYAAGPITEGGGGLAYFLAVQATLLVAQVVNFFAQRNITFKSNTSIWRAAFWYVVAYVVISLIAAVLQGFYKAPIYELFVVTWGGGAVGETFADVVTTLINATISFWVFFPIFKVIFRRTDDTAETAKPATATD
jgi:uncharacterized membrane protein YhaH (DUF805 family)